MLLSLETRPFVFSSSYYSIGIRCSTPGALGLFASGVQYSILMAAVSDRSIIQEIQFIWKGSRNFARITFLIYRYSTIVALTLVMHGERHGVCII